MFSYRDDVGSKVSIYFTKQEKECDDCLIIPLYEEKWLFTNHKVRGIEFPGGKGEGNETTIQAAIRELMEETGAYADTFHFIADYVVESADRTFTKRVFFARIKGFQQQNDYLETNGPVLMKGELAELVQQPEFSFFMRDSGMQEILKNLKEKLAKENTFLL
ncbi:Low G+C gram positive nudix hydrolase YtkD [Listeria fleischmannii 1991]|nr:nucleoside triphosphatase YtkD [Listeria fleischmannii]KMT60673.1 Low G+C gram positive nudix hydrolase YtkD [Listeria fleischmannii 1991]